MNHYEIRPEENKFTTLFVDLTHRCNMACANCYIPNRSIPDMDVEKLYDFAKRLPERVTFRLIGGEPTLRKDLPEIISTLKSLKHQTTLFSNGLLLADKALVQNVKAAGLDRIQLSMSGGTLNEVYQITDKMNAAEKKIQALENLVEAGIITSIGMIVVNEEISGKAIRTLVPLIERTYEKYGRRKDKTILVPSLRFRSIGKVGRYMDTDMPFTKLVDIVKRNLTQQEIQFKIGLCGSDYFREHTQDTTKSVIANYQSKIGPIYIKVTDWQVDDEGVIDPDSKNRGRITKNWNVAPFFEDIKANENNY